VKNTQKNKAIRFDLGEAPEKPCALLRRSIAGFIADVKINRHGKSSAQRSERLKVEEKILERPERTRRSREDREWIFDDGFESRSRCAEVFNSVY
jgi:hypothetical protein